MSGDNSQEFPGMPGEPEGSTAGSTTATSEPSRTVDGETGAGPESAATVADPADVLREERDKLRDQLLRTAADYDNFRKRTRKDLEESERRGREETVRELLPVFDNLERAMNAAATAKDVESIVEGVRMVTKLFEDHIARLGVTRVATVGQRFDPSMHEAIQQKETDEVPPGTVLTEIVPGYRLGDRLVRPAMVVVARKPAIIA